MKSLWNDNEAPPTKNELAMRVYTSRLLGQSEDLVLHGGGNTSLKTTTKDFFGQDVAVLYVKGSGWDLRTIEAPGFSPLRLPETQRLATLEELSDVDMARELRALLLNPEAPSPSVEAILHAIMPGKYVDHTHTDAVVTLTNTPNGAAIMRELYRDCLVLPYIMPGFVLSRQVAAAIGGGSLEQYRGIVLMHHGVFTWNNDAKTSYEAMIELVSRADAYIESKHIQFSLTEPSAPNLEDLARIRRAVSEARGKAQLAVLDQSADACAFSSRSDLAEICAQGPITPEHVIRTKRVPVLLDTVPDAGVPDVAAFGRAYEKYFERNQTGDVQMLDTAPRFAIWKGCGSIAFGTTQKECAIISDIARHTRRAIQVGEALGGWRALPEKDLFELEHWSLEQAKLKKNSATKPHAGKIALVTGAVGGIGRGTCRALARDGAVVVGLDIDAKVSGELAAEGMFGIACDVTDESQLKTAVDQVVKRFGGLDILVCNAGIFQSGERIEELDTVWDKTIAVNLTATQRLMKYAIPYLRLGVKPSILLVGSRNFAAPGPGAAAYSVSKAGITQLARVAALELASSGVRVNVIHPDAVFDTALWTREMLESSARRYNMTVEQYKTRNLLKTEISSDDVGALISTIVGPVFSATTGAQIPIDGGNDRVI